eukprot:gene1330-30763_t
MTKKKKGGRQQRAANANAAKEKEAAETKQKADAAAARAAAAAAAADDGTQCGDYGVVVIGGGPHSLAALSALNEPLSAYPVNGDRGVNRITGGSFQTLKFKRIGKVAVVDPAPNYMNRWRSQFAALEIDKLRSPMFAHPDAYDDNALLNFAVEQNRVDEITNPPATSRGNHGTQNLNGKGRDMGRVMLNLEGLPSSALFQDFCDALAKRLEHDWVQGTAVDIKRVTPGAGGAKYEVTTTHTLPDGTKEDRTLIADAVILATGPCGLPKLPTCFEPFASSPQLIHTTDLFSSGMSLQEAVKSKVGKMVAGSTAPILVIGGGLSAAQAAIAAHRAGAAVVLRSRRKLMTKSFDLEDKWLQFRMMNKLRYDFLSTPLDERVAALQEAVDGGSVPAAYIRELEAAASVSERFRVDVDEHINASDVRIGPASWVGEMQRVAPTSAGRGAGAGAASAVIDADDLSSIFVNGVEFSLVILATGTSLDIAGSPLHTKVAARFPTKLELGPGALNLMGAKVGANLVANELMDLIWSTPKAQVPAASSGKLHGNSFAMLGGMSSSEDEDEDDDEEEEHLAPRRPPIRVHQHAQERGHLYAMSEGEAEAISPGWDSEDVRPATTCLLVSILAMAAAGAPPFDAGPQSTKEVVKIL